MAWLPDGEKISKISLFVLTQLTNVTDTQTDRHRMTAQAGLMHRIARQKRCTSIVHRKLIKVDCSDNWGNIYVPRQGRARPVFSLDRRRCRLFRNYSSVRCIFSTLKPIITRHRIFVYIEQLIPQLTQRNSTSGNSASTNYG